jgi:hypothetical protein
MKRRLIYEIVVLLFFILATVLLSSVQIKQNYYELTAEDVIRAAKSVDFDKDSSSNYYDNCPAIYNPDQTDSNRNGIGDACETQ